MVNFIWENIFKREDPENNLATVLRENLLFQDLSRKELKFVENIVHLRHYRAEEYVFRQGEIGIGMYIIVKGGIDIFVSDPLLEQSGVKDILVTRLGTGDFFGELSLVEDNGPRSASAKAHEDAVLVGFFKPDLMEMLERSPRAGVKVLFQLAAVLGKRLKETTDKISQLRKELKLLRQQNFPRPMGPGERPTNDSDPRSTET